MKKLELCSVGRHGPNLTRLCRRCARGDTVEVLGSYGPVCVRHGRWCGHGADLDVSAFPEILRAQRQLNGAMRQSDLTMASSEARFIQGMLYGWSEWGDMTARTDISIAAQIVDLPVIVRGMLLLASPEFLDLVDDAVHGLGRGVKRVQEFLRMELARPQRARIIERLDSRLGLSIGDEPCHSLARVSGLAGSEVSKLWRRGDFDHEREWILEDLRRTELASCRSRPRGSHSTGPLRQPEDVQRWESIRSRKEPRHPTHVQW